MEDIHGWKLTVPRCKPENSACAHQINVVAYLFALIGPLTPEPGFTFPIWGPLGLQ